MSSILFIDQSGQVGGAELCLADIAVAHRESGKVLLFSPGPFADHLEQRGVCTSVLPLPPALAGVTKSASPRRLLACVPAAASYFTTLRREQSLFDLIYLNTAKALLFGVAASVLTRQRRVFHLHDILDRQHFSSTNIRLVIGAANQTHAVIANSEATAEAFRQAGGQTPVHVVPNGFDKEPFDQVSEERMAAIRTEWNPSGKVVVAIFGRLARWKGQHLLMEAATRVPGFAVWVVGEALFTEDDRAYAEELRALAAKHKDFHMLGFRDDIPALMRAADIVVNCSVAAEPFGRVIVEGMLAGRPVVAPRAGGPAEIVQDNVTGSLFDPGDVSQLSACLGRLAESPSRREEMGAAGRQRAEQHYLNSIVQPQINKVLSAVSR